MKRVLPMLCLALAFVPARAGDPAAPDRDEVVALLLSPRDATRARPRSGDRPRRHLRPSGPPADGGSRPGPGIVAHGARGPPCGRRRRRGGAARPHAGRAEAKRPAGHRRARRVPGARRPQARAPRGEPGAGSLEGRGPAAARTDACARWAVGADRDRGAPRVRGARRRAGGEGGDDRRSRPLRAARARHDPLSSGRLEGRAFRDLADRGHTIAVRDAPSAPGPASFRARSYRCPRSRAGRSAAR